MATADRFPAEVESLLGAALGRIELLAAFPERKLRAGRRGHSVTDHFVLPSPGTGRSLGTRGLMLSLARKDEPR